MGCPTATVSKALRDACQRGTRSPSTRRILVVKAKRARRVCRVRPLRWRKIHTLAHSSGGTERRGDSERRNVTGIAKPRLKPFQHEHMSAPADGSEPMVPPPLREGQLKGGWELMRTHLHITAEFKSSYVTRRGAG